MSLARNTTQIMRSIRITAFGGPEVLKVVSDAPIPTVSDSEVLIKVKAAGVNPVDTYIRQGTYGALPTLPYTPGQDVAGIVEKVGKDVNDFKVGDRVYTVRTVSGAYAEYATAIPQYLGKLGDRLSFEEGASIGVPYYTAYRALLIKAGGKAGDNVLIHGASGAVGLASVQLAKSLGLTVIGTAGSPEGIKLVKDNGADYVFSHKDSGYTDQIMKTVPGGVDIILEMLSNVNLGKDLEIINPQGRIIIIGCRGTVEINPRLTMKKECIVTGMALMGAKEPEWKQMRHAMEAGINYGWVKPHIGQTFSLEEAHKAHDVVINNSGAQGKIILKI